MNRFMLLGSTLLFGISGCVGSSDDQSDTTAPAVPTVISLTTESSTATITGTFDASDVAGGFTVQVNGITYTLGTDAALTSSGNNWSLAIPGANALALGTYEIVATATDGSGNAATDSSSNELVVHDITAPTAPTVTSLTTESTTPTINGTFDASDVAGGFTVRVNGVTYTLGTDAALTNSGNTWSLTIPSGNTLALGTYEVVATATDGSGNSATDTSGNELVIVDITAPAVPTVSSLSTESTTPTITGTFDANDIAGGFTVRVNGVTYTLGTDAALTSSGNNWNLIIPGTNVLALGTYEIVATATDGSGNAATDSTSNELVVQDITAPTAPTVSSLSTESTTPTITGTFDASDVAGGFTVQVNGVTYTLGTDAALTNSGNTWSLIIPGTNVLALGTYEIVATATDGSGNAATDSTSNELVVQDITAPTAPTVTSLTTESTTPTITGTFDASDVAGGFTVQVNGVTYTLGTDAALTNSGNTWSLIIPGTNALALGTYEIVATATDGSGNAATDSTSNELVVQDITAPNVSAVTPTDSSTDIVRTTTLTATFNEDIFASTVSDSSFTLTGNNPVNGSVTFDALTNKATFTPDTSLPLLTHYTASLSTDITDLSGNALSSTYSWSFTTADGTLSTTSEQVQSDTTNNVRYPSVSYNADGSAFALWKTMSKAYPYQYGLLVNHYAPGSGWGTPVILQAESGNNIQYQLAANDNGETFAIWSLGTSGVWVSRYLTATESWATATQISLADAGSAGDVSIAVNSDGSVLAVWSQKSSGGELNIYANHYTAGTGWGTAETIENMAGDTYFAKVGFDGSGNAIAVWAQNDGSQFSVYGNRFVAGSGWGNASLLETIDTQPADFVMEPLLAVDNSGNAIVVWPHSDGTRDNLWSNRYDPNTGWGTAELLESHDEKAAFPELAMNRSGTAILVWVKYDTTTGTASYLSRRYMSGTGWAAEETFDYSQQSYYHADVGIDDSGNALFFWEYDDNTNGYIRFNRYSAGSGWGSATTLSNVGNDYGDWSPMVSVKSDGEAMLISGGSSTGSTLISTRLFE